MRIIQNAGGGWPGVSNACIVWGTFKKGVFCHDVATKERVQPSQDLPDIFRRKAVYFDEGRYGNERVCER